MYGNDIASYPVSMNLLDENLDRALITDFEEELRSGVVV